MEGAKICFEQTMTECCCFFCRYLIEFPLFLYGYGHRSKVVVGIKQTLFGYAGVDYSLVEGFLRQRRITTILFESIPLVF